MSTDICLTNTCTFYSPVKNKNKEKKTAKKLSSSSTTWQNDRKDLMMNMWSSFDKQINDVRSESYSNLFDSLLLFIRNHSLHKINDTKVNFDEFHYGLIPTALVSLGIHFIIIYKKKCFRLY